MKKQEQELALTEEQLALLNESYPVSDDDSKLFLPRFGMLAKDIIEETGTGKNKKIKVLQAAGSFYTEEDEGETNEDGKNVWTKTFIDEENVDVHIVYHRYQLKYYDKGLEKFYSTPIYDNPDQILPLYLDKKIVKKGTEKELQAMYPKLTVKGKPSSDLKKLTILYIVYNGKLYQFNLSTSSGWEFSSYKRKINPATVVTILGSKGEAFGSNVFSKTTFTKGRTINQNEFQTIADAQGKVKESAISDAQLLLSTSSKEVEEDMEETFNNM